MLSKNIYTSIYRYYISRLQIQIGPGGSMIFSFIFKLVIIKIYFKTQSNYNLYINVDDIDKKNCVSNNIITIINNIIIVLNTSQFLTMF